MSTGVSSSTMGISGPPGLVGSTTGNSGGGGTVGSTGIMISGSGSVVDPRAVSVVVSLPGPQHGQALSDYGPI